MGKADKRSAAAKTGITSPQDWTNTSRVVRVRTEKNMKILGAIEWTTLKTSKVYRQNSSHVLIFIQGAVNRWSWQQGSGLMPVLEEDEEGSDLPGDEEGEPEGEAHAEKTPHNQGHQVTSA